MGKISDDFNALPFEARKIASKVIAKTQINQIKIDQHKAKAAYQKFMRETNQQIKNIEATLEQGE